MDECHGLLLVHDDGSYECLDPDCESLDPVRHDWRAGCDAIDEACRACTGGVAQPHRHAA